MRTSALFGSKNFGFFRVYVCPHGQGEGGQFFAILCGRLLWTAPKVYLQSLLIIFSHFLW